MRWAIVAGALLMIGLAAVLPVDGLHPLPALAAKEDPAAPAAEPPPEQRAAAVRAAQIVDEALARRELAPEDVTALRQLGPLLPPPAREELRMKMIQALNRQELKLDPRAGLP